MNNNTLFFQTKKFEQKNIKELDNGDIEVTGYASTKNIDSYNDIVEPTAFEKYFSTFKRNPVLLLGHNQDKAIGVVIEAKVDKKGLKIKAVIKNNIDNIKEQILNGTVKGFSIGYIPKKVDFEQKEVDGKNVIIRRLIEVELKEISIVSVPANPYSLFNSAKKYFNELKNMTINKLEIKGENGITSEMSFKDISEEDLIKALKYIEDNKNNEDIENNQDNEIINNDEVQTLDEIEDELNDNKINENIKEEEKNDGIIISEDIFKALINEIKQSKEEIKELKKNVNNIGIKKGLYFKKQNNNTIQIKQNDTNFIEQTLV